MREIKFRAVKQTVGGFAYGDLVNSFEGTHIIESDYFKPSNDEPPTLTEVNASTVGQYTGLKDKNGKEIYEGDVVTFWGGHGRVIYFEPYARFMIQYTDNDVTGVYNNSHEIIGNIYENPELLNN